MEYEHSQSMAIDFGITQALLQQPHVYMRPRIFLDGNSWCCLYGEDLQIGVCAFGNTPQQAARNFDLVWLNGGMEKGTPNDQSK